MSKADKKTSRDDPESYPIPGEPLKIAIDQILVRELHREKGKEPRYRRIDRPVQFCGDTQLRRLVRKVARSSSWEGEFDKEERHFLDIPVYKSSYIVIKVSEYYESFVPPGIDLAWKNDAYGEIRYVDDEGNISDKWPTSRPCKVIYFKARLKTGTYNRPYIQSINYYTLKDRKSKNRGRVDPDIRYPGNGGQR